MLFLVFNKNVFKLAMVFFYAGEILNEINN